MEQDIITWTFVKMHSPTLKGKRACLYTASKEVFGTFRRDIIKELNDNRYKIIQFINDTEILVEKII